MAYEKEETCRRAATCHRKGTTYALHHTCEWAKDLSIAGEIAKRAMMEVASTKESESS
jgi:hypothetical protein